jgi:hypothetical protein
VYGKDEMKYEAQDTSAAPATKMECKAEDVSFPFSTCKLLMQQQLDPVIVTDYIEYGTENDEETNGGVYWKSLDIFAQEDKFWDMSAAIEENSDDKFPDEDSYDDMPTLVSFHDAGSDGESSDSEHPITVQNSSAYIESLHYRHKVEEEKEKGKKRKERKAKEEGKRINS